MEFVVRSLLALLAGLGALWGLAVGHGGPPPRPPVRAVANSPFTLHAVNQQCFFAPTTPSTAIWPLRSQQNAHTIRSGLNDPRTPVHYATDVWATRNRQPVYAMQDGVIHAIKPSGFYIGGALHSVSYGHVTPLPELYNGETVRRGQLLGHILDDFWHVNIAERSAPCGFVDPRRPTGPLHDPHNSEPAVIGPIEAYVANRTAYPQPRLRADPATRSDHSTSESLFDLHGRVDFRASVTDTPRRRPPMNPALNRRFPEHAQTPAAIRGYLAPLSDWRRHFVTYRVFVGATVMPASAVRTTWAYGTWRSDACYYHWTAPASSCAQAIIWHTARSGFNTRRVPNGTYQWCVEALTINGTSSHRCVSVTIRN